MKISQKTNSVLVIVFSSITISLAILSFFHFIKTDIMMLFLGFTQFFSGLNQMNMEQQIDSKGISRGNKSVGRFSIILGAVIVIAVIIKMIM